MNRLQWLIADYRLNLALGMSEPDAWSLAWQEFIGPKPLPF